jgi:hypothetical protein
MLKTRLGFWSSTRTVDFQVCLIQIACIRVGRIILQHGMNNSKATKRIAQSFLKPWLTMRLEFGMLFLGFPVLAMISMFFRDPHS